MKLKNAAGIILLIIAALYVYLSYVVSDPIELMTFFSYAYIALVNVALFVSVFAVAMNVVKLKLRSRRITVKKNVRVVVAVVALVVVFLYGGRDVAGKLYLKNLLAVSAIAFLYMLYRLLPESVRQNNPLKNKSVKRIVSIATAVILLYAGAAIYKQISGDYIGVSTEDKLKSLPYVTWVPSGDKSKMGVTMHEKGRAYAGLNIFVEYKGSEIHLMDMEGEYVHTWRLPEGMKAMTVRVLKGGDILVCAIKKSKRYGSYRGQGIYLLDSDSNVKWHNSVRAHHEVNVDENGDIYVLGRSLDMVRLYGLPVPILNDNVTILSADGILKREIDLFEPLKEDISFAKVADIYRTIFKKAKHLPNVDTMVAKIYESGKVADVFHNNTITFLDRTTEGIGKKGDLLISPRNLNIIGVLDMETEKLIWKWGPGELEWQHYPEILENGNFLIYDNGVERMYTRIIELDPKTKKIVWEYKAAPETDFFNRIRGSNQRLPNGNTLIADSDHGRVFEIDPAGETVWEYYSPIYKNKDERRAIYRMLRITDNEKLPAALRN